MCYRYEAINNDIYIHLDPFTAENDLLTPTLYVRYSLELAHESDACSSTPSKTKRNVAAKKFAAQLKALYSNKEKTNTNYKL